MGILMTAHNDIPPIRSIGDQRHFAALHTLTCIVMSSQSSFHSIRAFLTIFSFVSSKFLLRLITADLNHNTHNFTICKNLALTLSTKHAARKKSPSHSLRLLPYAVSYLCSWKIGFFRQFPPDKHCALRSKVGAAENT